MEIERQFLVTELPPLPKEYESIRQGYVAFLPEIRIREINGRQYVLTVKRGAGLVRAEWETDISKEEFDSLAARLYPGQRSFMSMTDSWQALATWKSNSPQQRRRRNFSRRHGSAAK